MCIHTHAINIHENRAINSKVRREGYLGEFGAKEREGEILVL